MTILLLNQYQSKVMARLLKAEITFLVIGAQAMRAHGIERVTIDIDIWVDRSNANAKKLNDVLPQFLTAVTFGISPETLAQPNKLIRLPDQYVHEVDVITSLGQLDFQRAHDRRCIALWGSLQLPFLALDDLYQSKRQSNDPKDQADAELLARHLQAV